MQSKRILVYPIGKEHVEQLLGLAIQTFDETFASTNSEEDMRIYSDRCFRKEVFLDEMECSASWFYFAEYDGQLAGYLKVNVGMAQTELREDDGFEVERIYILKEYYGSGVGAALLEKAIEKGRELDKKYLWLGVWEYNFRAQSFYRKFGMKEFDEHVFLMGNTPQRDVLMKLEL